MKTELSRVYTLMCPHCGREIKYDQSYYNKTIMELKAQITSIQLQLVNHPFDGSQESKEWRRRAKEAMNIKVQQVQELKAIRAAGNVVLKQHIDRAFVSLVKEKVGEDNFAKWMYEAEKRIEYENIGNLMQNKEGEKDG